MTISQYATAADLEAYIGNAYVMPDEPDRLLLRASELIGEKTFQRSEGVWFVVDVDHPTNAYTDALRLATCAQVEFWLEVGEEFDVTNAQGSMAISRVQIHKLPPKLALRAFRYLFNVGLISAMTGIAP